MIDLNKYISKDRKEYNYQLYLYSSNNDKLIPNFLYLDNPLISNIKFFPNAYDLDGMVVEYHDDFFEFNLGKFDISGFTSILNIHNSTGQRLIQIQLNRCELKASTNSLYITYKQELTSAVPLLLQRFEDSKNIYTNERNIYLRDIKIDKIIY